MMAERPDDDARFVQRADQYMAGLLARLDHFDPDELEADLGMGVLKITFADGRKCIMNRQTAAQQIWLAEGASAWHFVFDGPRASWLDTKGRGELATILAAILTTKLGRQIAL
ncbi:MAG TPA: iron donor protein CyaY [Planctomycetota bacterium]|nr:iron donor protein CyaY [Planctomycetota bacterium]